MELPNRKSIRLKDYDYSQDGAYFVTICTQNREYIMLNPQMWPARIAMPASSASHGEAGWQSIAGGDRDRNNTDNLYI